MTSMRRELAARVVMIAILMAGCAKAPATTSAVPSPTGTSTSGSSSTSGGAGMTAGTTGRAGGNTGSLGSTGSGARVNPGDYTVEGALTDVHFDFDKYDISASEAARLDGHASWLKEHGDRLILIEGHCDERGTTDYNVALGERRAKATMNYLVSRGVSASRIAIVSYGEERPGCKAHTEGCWAENRRAHFLAKRG